MKGSVSKTNKLAEKIVLISSIASPPRSGSEEFVEGWIAHAEFVARKFEETKKNTS